MIKKMIMLTVSILAIQASAMEVEIFKNASINTCARGSLGCAPTVMLENGNSLLLDQSYARDFLNNYNSIDPNKAQNIKVREIMGVVVSERGHFPNPTVDFEVIKVMKIIE